MNCIDHHVGIEAKLLFACILVDIWELPLDVLLTLTTSSFQHFPWSLTGLDITAGQQTMSKLIAFGELTGQPFVLPVILTCHIQSYWNWNKLKFPCCSVISVASTSCKSTWDTVPYFGINGLSMILCLWSPLHPLSKLLALQDHTQNLEEQLWMGGRREISIIFYRPVTRSDLKQERSFFRGSVSSFLQLVAPMQEFLGELVPHKCLLHWEQHSFAKLSQSHCTFQILESWPWPQGNPIIYFHWQWGL